MHCPQCGKPMSEQAVACQFCGNVLDAPRGGAGGPRPMARTVLGVIEPVARAPSPQAVPGGSPGGPGAVAAVASVDPRVGANTVLGIPAPAPAHAEPADRVSSQLLKTKLGFQPLPQEIPARGQAAPSLRAQEPAPAPDNRAKGSPAEGRERRSEGGGQIPSTLPSMAERGRSRDYEPARGSNGHEPAGELGATIVNQLSAARAPAKRLKVHAMHIPRPVPPSMQRKAARANADAKRARIQGNTRPSPQGSRAVIAVVIGAAALAAGAVLFAMLWPGRAPVKARPATDAQSRETVELSCSSCPDGTTLSIGQATATVTGGAAVLTLGEPLAAGDNRFKVRVDRPGSERDEAVPLVVHLPYRIRPELGTLQGERPAIQVVVEAAPGARVALEGRQVPLVGGRAVETFDVIDAITGLTGETKSLSRQIPYVVTPKDGEPERGSVSVMVGVVPLELDAPGPNVVIDGPSFVLAGRTLKGAELFAAGKPVPVKADGSFAHVMNVSSIGATQIEVRAKLAGMAPRLTRIKVRRVDSIETAVREFAAESPITYAALGGDVARHAGRPIVVAGQVIEVKRENHRTTMILDVGAQAGCKGCTAHLVQGSSNPAQPGEQITAYGRVKRAMRAPSGADVPEVEVDFTVKGLR